MSSAQAHNRRRTGRIAKEGAAWDWLISITASISVGAVAVAAWVGVLEYKRLQASTRSEIDTRLSKLFVELMWLAHGRGGSQVSEKCVEQLFDKGIITREDFDAPESLRDKLEAACILRLPVGMASQDAAITSIAVLGSSHEILREPAIAALNTLKSFKSKTAEKALMLLNE